MHENFDNCVLIIVGTYEDICQERGVDPNAVAAMLGALGSKYKLDVYQCESDSSALSITFSYIKHANLEPNYDIVCIKVNLGILKFKLTTKRDYVEIDNV